MKKYEVWASTNLIGSKSKIIIEVEEDDLTEDELSKLLLDELFQTEIIRWDYNEI